MLKVVLQTDNFMKCSGLFLLLAADVAQAVSYKRDDDILSLDNLTA
jgi:hypothetical protein